MAITHKLISSDAHIGEAFVAPLTTRLAATFGCNSFILEGDALLVGLAINTPPPFFLIDLLLIVYQKLVLSFSS